MAFMKNNPLSEKSIAAKYPPVMEEPLPEKSVLLATPNKPLMFSGAKIWGFLTKEI